MLMLMFERVLASQIRGEFIGRLHLLRLSLQLMFDKNAKCQTIRHKANSISPKLSTANRNTQQIVDRYTIYSTLKARKNRA